MNGNGKEKTEVVTAEIMPQIVRPVVDVTAAKAAWDEYIQICNEILEENDYFYYVRAWEGSKEIRPVGFRTLAKAEEHKKKLSAMPQFSGTEITKAKKRSAWDKLARFFGFTIPKLEGALATTDVSVVGPFIVEKHTADGFSMVIYQDAGSLQVVKASSRVAVVAPNGRTEIGDGICSVNERSKGADSFAHADHDIPTTAFTRAMNRAISRCIGAGEVSAEEMESDMGSGAGSGNTVSAPVAAAPGQTSAPKMTEAPKAEPEKHPRQKAAAKQEPKSEPVPEAKTEADAADVLHPHPEPKPGTYQPLGEGATNEQKLKALEAWVYAGQAVVTNKRQDQLVRYAILLVPTVINPQIESKPGHWDMKKWRAAVLALSPESRRERVDLIEKYASNCTPEEFKKWALAQANEAWGEVKP